MRSDVKLKSISLKYADAIASIHCRLTNNQESPVFEKKGGQFKSPCTLDFSDHERVAFVAAAENKEQ